MKNTDAQNLSYAATAKREAELKVQADDQSLQLVGLMESITCFFIRLVLIKSLSPETLTLFLGPVLFPELSVFILGHLFSAPA